MAIPILSHRSIHYNPAVLIKRHTKSTAVFVHTLQDPLLILPRCRRRSEIIPCFDRAYHTGNDPGVLILHLFPVLKSKDLLDVYKRQEYIWHFMKQIFRFLSMSSPALL